MQHTGNLRRERMIRDKEEGASWIDEKNIVDNSDSSSFEEDGRLCSSITAMKSHEDRLISRLNLLGKYYADGKLDRPIPAEAYIDNSIFIEFFVFIETWKRALSLIPENVVDEALIVKWIMIQPIYRERMEANPNLPRAEMVSLIISEICNYYYFHLMRTIETNLEDVRAHYGPDLFGFFIEKVIVWRNSVLGMFDSDGVEEPEEVQPDRPATLEDDFRDRLVGRSSSGSSLGGVFGR